MKNISLGLIFTLAFLPQLSFGLTVQQQQDAESLAFFQQQAADRAAFIKAHPDIIAKQDKYGKALMAWKDAQSHNKSGIPLPMPQSTLTPQDESTFATLTQKQQGDRNNFLQHLGQERQAALGSQPVTNPVGK